MQQRRLAASRGNEDEGQRGVGNPGQGVLDCCKVRKDLVLLLPLYAASTSSRVYVLLAVREFFAYGTSVCQ